MRLMLADRRLETGLLRTNIRNGINRQEDGGEGGMDFYSPFWADAKSHVRRASDLRTETEGRVAASAQRRRLYPMLANGFLSWWEERRRRRNEPFHILERSVRGRCVLDGLGVVKVENNLSFQIGDDGLRIVYPYFSDEPAITTDMARQGLWLMSQALPTFAIADMRILDVIRGNSFSIEECVQTGTEEAEVRAEYDRLLTRWRELRAEYD